jgi:simple sugar transport system permease protein
MLTPIWAVLLALLVGAFMILALGANPIEAYRALLNGAAGNKNAIADTLVKATPLMFISVGICVSFRGGVINIGGEGQMIMGALGATLVALNMENSPGWLIITLACFVGFMAGALWGIIPGFLRAYLNVNEILSTVMMNVIAVQLMNYLLAGPMIDPEQIEMGTRIPQTARFARQADLPRLWLPTRLHAGFIIAILIALVIWVLLWRTPIGYRIRAVGLNQRASKYAGISVGRYAMLSLTLSGALAGLAGAIQVLGLSHRMITDGSAGGFTGSAGFNGIVVALFGGLHPIGTIPASILFGGLLVGANQLQRTTQVPSALAITLNGLVVIFVVASQTWSRRRAVRIDTSLEEGKNTVAA